MSTSDSDSSDEQMEIVQADPQNQQLSDSDNNADSFYASNGKHDQVPNRSPNQEATSQNVELSSDSDEDDKGSAKSDTDAKERLRQKLLLSDSDSDAGSKKSIDAEEQFTQNLNLSDSDGEAAPEPEVIVDEIPTNRLNLGDMGPLFVRLPNFLSIEPKPFDERTYEPEMDDDEIVDAEGRARMKLKIENTIRWRNVRDPETGEVKKQSNAKIIKWSDGTMSLHLGNEIFDLQRTKAMPNLHLFTRQGASLQAQAPFKQKLTFRPHSTDTLTHRKMTMNMADKSNRTQKVKMVTDVGMNPEKARLESIKKEDEKLRALARKQAAQRRARERTREAGLSSNFLEGYGSGEDEENVGALKRAYSDFGRGNRPYTGNYSDESDDGEEERNKSIMRARVISSSDEEDSQSKEARASGSEPRTKTRVIEDD